MVDIYHKDSKHQLAMREKLIELGAQPGKGKNPRVSLLGADKYAEFVTFLKTLI